MDLAPTFLTLGGLFLAGLVADALGRRTHLPRVTLLLACGVVVGRAGFDLIPLEVQALFDFLSVTALTLVAFLVGSSLTTTRLSRNGPEILWVSWSIVAVTLALVAAGLWLAGLPLALALILAAAATATDPAATEDTLRQAGARGSLPDTIRGVVAVDDAWGLIVFSLALVFATSGAGGDGGQFLLTALWEISGAILLGLALGLPAAMLTGRLMPGEPLQTEALVLVTLTAGLAIWLEVSFLLAGMTAGAVIANRARHHDRAFHEIEQIEWPFMMLFFLLAGATLELDALREIGWIGLAYVGLRTAARTLGGWVGAALAGAPPAHRRWIGPALLPQAGVALGMALVAAEAMPQHARLIMTLTVTATVVFELAGPPVTMLALRRTGSTAQGNAAPGSRNP